jgi:hypothetical protein
MKSPQVADSLYTCSGSGLFDDAAAWELWLSLSPQPRKEKKKISIRKQKIASGISKWNEKFKRENILENSINKNKIKWIFDTFFFFEPTLMLWERPAEPRRENWEGSLDVFLLVLPFYRSPPHIYPAGLASLSSCAASSKEAGGIQFPIKPLIECAARRREGKKKKKVYTRLGCNYKLGTTWAAI